MMTFFFAVLTQAVCLAKYHKTSRINENAVKDGVPTARQQKMKVNKHMLPFKNKNGQSWQNQLISLAGQQSPGKHKQSAT